MSYNDFMISFNQINYNESFPHLNHAPITEAVIDLRVVSVNSWDEKTLQQQLKQRLTNYPKINENREIKFVLGVDGKQQTKEDLGCVGLRLTSADEHYVAQFNKSGLVLSRLKKYEDWPKFCSEAKRLWELYSELLKPNGVNRIGLRFINRISADYKSSEFLKVLKDAPKSKQVAGWELQNFIHRDVLRIPKTNYFVGMVKTIISEAKLERGISVVLDTDVYYENEENCDWKSIEGHLLKMRWIKNKAFFSSVSASSIQELKK